MAKAKKMPSGNWRIQPSLHLEDGTFVRTSITAPTKDEANRLAVLWKTTQDHQQQRNKTLNEAISEYIQSCEKSGASPTTIKEYSSRQKTSFPDIINCKLSNLTPAMIQRQTNNRLETVSLKTVRNDFYLLKPVLALHAPNINLSRIKIGKKTKRKKLKMKESWRTEIPLKIAKLYGKNDFYLYVLFLIYAGLRPSEAYALTWHDVSYAPITKLVNGATYEIGHIFINKAQVRDKNNSYQIKEPKTESGNRQLTLDWSFFKELYSVRHRGDDHDKIFHINPYCNDRRWKHIKHELNLPSNLRQYDLRHFHATDIAYSGASEEEIMERLGHSTSSFSHSVYIELFEEHDNLVNANLALKTSTAMSALADQKNA